MLHTFAREQFIERAVDEIFAFYADAANLELMTPAWLNFHILTPMPIEMRPGARIDYRIRLRGLPVTWRTEIVEWDPPRRFIDVQLRGPYRTWEHTHEFHPVSGGTVVRDSVRYELPAGWLGEVLRRAVVSRDINAIFEHRRACLARIFSNQS